MQDIDDKQALAILRELLGSDRLAPEEKQAIKKAIGILGWTSLAKNRFIAMRKRKEEDAFRG